MVLTQNTRAALWLVLSCLGATGMSVCVRVVGPETGSVNAVFWRCVLGMWVILPILLTGRWRLVRFTRPWLHLLRGVLFVAAINCGFYALSTLPLTTATTLFFLAPIIATALSALFRGEQVGIRRWLAVGAGFVGALVILRPGFSEVSLGMLTAVGSAMLFAWALIISKSLSDADGAESILISASVISMLIMLPVVMLPVEGDGLVWPDNLQWIWLLGLSLFSSVRMFADIRAYSMGEAGFLAPFAYLRLIFIAIAAYLIFTEIPDRYTLIGAAIIVSSTIYITHREARLKRARRVSAGP